MSLDLVPASPDTATAARNGSPGGSAQRWGADGASPAGGFAALFQTASGATVHAVRRLAGAGPADAAPGETVGPDGQGEPAGPAASPGPVRPIAPAGTDVAETPGEGASGASVAMADTGTETVPAAVPSVLAAGLGRQGAPVIGGELASTMPLESSNPAPGSTPQSPGHGAVPSLPATVPGAAVPTANIPAGMAQQPAQLAAGLAAAVDPAPVTVAASIGPGPTGTVPATASTPAAVSVTTTPTAEAVSTTLSAAVAASGTAPGAAGGQAPPVPGRAPRSPAATAAAMLAPALSGEVPDVRVASIRSADVTAMPAMPAMSATSVAPATSARGDAVAGAPLPGAPGAALAGPTMVPPDPAATNGVQHGTTLLPTAAGQPGTAQLPGVAVSTAAPTVLLPGQLRAMSRTGTPLSVPGSLESPIPRPSGSAGAGSGGTMNARLRTGVANAMPFTAPQGLANGEVPNAVPVFASAEALARRAAMATDPALAARLQVSGAPGATLPGMDSADSGLQAPVATPGTAGVTVATPVTPLTGLSGTGQAVAVAAAASTGASMGTHPVPLLGADASRDISDTIRLTLAQGRQVARIELTPAELGTMTVELEQRQDGRLSVSLHSPANATRDLVESMIPRLREQLANDGYASVSVDLGERGEEGERRGARHGLFAGADPDRNAGDSRAGGERAGSERTGGAGERASGERAAGERPDTERERGGERGPGDGNSGTTDASPSNRTRSSGSLAASPDRVLDAWI